MLNEKKLEALRVEVNVAQYQYSMLQSKGFKEPWEKYYKSLNIGGIQKEEKNSKEESKAAWDHAKEIDQIIKDARNAK